MERKSKLKIKKDRDLEEVEKESRRKERRKEAHTKFINY